LACGQLLHLTVILYTGIAAGCVVEAVDTVARAGVPALSAVPGFALAAKGSAAADTMAMGIAACEASGYDIVTFKAGSVTRTFRRRSRLPRTSESGVGEQALAHVPHKDSTTKKCAAFQEARFMTSL